MSHVGVVNVTNCHMGEKGDLKSAKKVSRITQKKFISPKFSLNPSNTWNFEASTITT